MDILQGAIDFLLGGLKAIIDFVFDILFEVFKFILEFLPDSPFRNLQQHLSPIVVDYLGYANYYIPFDVILGIFLLWLSAIAAYYVRVIILRLIKAVK